MTLHTTSFKAWVLARVNEVLCRKPRAAPWLLWCDPREEWRDLLRLAAADAPFTLWESDPTDGAFGELVLRHRFASEERKPRVVWVPAARGDITWFRVFELEADGVWEQNLLDALRAYGVKIRRNDELALAPLLAPHAREWFAEPQERWAELTPGNAKSALVDDERVFSALAGPDALFAELVAEDRFEVFARRAVEDFGLPLPVAGDRDAIRAWRIEALSHLLATEAAEAAPSSPPSEGTRIIPAGARRERALALLRRWQTHIAYIASLEELVPMADARLGLTWWAKNASHPPRSRASRAVEQVLLDEMLGRIERIENVDLLTRELERAAPAILERANGFWAKTAQDKVRWVALADLARAASALVEHHGVETHWRQVRDAVAWYTERGWRLDTEGEGLFVENDALPSAMARIRARLRRAYLRAVDRTGVRFSELLSAESADIAGLPSAGELALDEVERRKGPMALVFLDACRFDLGCRLAELLNTGEARPRADVRAAVAPVPSITALGMAFALPMARSALTVSFPPNGRGFRVEADGFKGDLTQKQQREKWLATKLKVAECLSVADVLSDGFVAASPRSKRLIAVHGDEFDAAGHDDQLELTGAEAHVERYARAIRRLRDKGYSRIVVVTDHGFFHWQPETDEIEKEKPTKGVLWESRRAMVGIELNHRTALVLPVPRSDLTAAIPRSVNVWRTYGGLGFRHGGATLQELIIPIVTVNWPVRTSKVGVVLKPVGNITSRRPRVEVQASADALFVAEGLLARRVVVRVQDAQGRVVFRHDDPLLVQAPINAAGFEPITLQLALVPIPPEGITFGADLDIILRDGDDDEELAREPVVLKVDLDDWD